MDQHAIRAGTQADIGADEAVPKTRMVHFGPFGLDVHAAELRKNGIKIRLHDQPFRILLMMLNRPGEVVLREEIRGALWPDNTVVEFDHSINAAIQRLRDALGDSAERPRYVETVARRGYRFIAELAADPNDQRLAPPQTEKGAAAAAKAKIRYWASRIQFSWIIAGVSVIVAAVVWFIPLREKQIDESLVQFQVTIPANVRFVADTEGGIFPSVSPDGKWVAFPAIDSIGKMQLWLRPLDSPNAWPLAGTDGGHRICWSPDSKSIGFFAADNLAATRGPGQFSWKLKRVNLATGGAMTLVEGLEADRGCAWNRDGVIVYGAIRNGPLYRVAASGGSVSPITNLDARAGDLSHRFPFFLPDGKHFLYVAVRREADHLTIRIGSIDSSEEIVSGRSLLEADSFVQYSQNRLLFMRASALMARPFDPKRLTFNGDAAPIVEQVQRGTTLAGYAAFAAAANGWLVYQRAAGAGAFALTWFDRAGHRLETLGEPGDLWGINLSPDGRNIALTVQESTAVRNIWIYDILRRLRTRFTFSRASDDDGVWAPDGKSVVFSSDRKGSRDLYRKHADGTASEELLYADNTIKCCPALPPDGKYLAYQAGSSEKSSIDIWILPEPLGAPGSSKPYAFVRTGFAAMNPRFSPDGKWLAFQSNESGHHEIYVAPFPGPGAKRRVSPSGGVDPRWRRDGKELYYRGEGETLMAATIDLRSGLAIGKVEPLFGPLISRPLQLFYDVSADGKHFLVVAPPEHPNAEPLIVMQNWTAALKR